MGRQHKENSITNHGSGNRLLSLRSKHTRVRNVKEYMDGGLRVRSAEYKGGTMEAP